jgi:hypothetical protein
LRERDRVRVHDFTPSPYPLPHMNGGEGKFHQQFLQSSILNPHDHREQEEIIQDALKSIRINLHQVENLEGLVI